MDGRNTADDIPSFPSNHSIILDLPPSCIEFSPLHSDCFMVGTYYLEPESGASIRQEDDQIRRPAQNRRGSLILFGLRDRKP